MVGKNSGSNIKELDKLQDLRGYLHIRSLENVVDVEDVSMANSKKKKYIKELTLEWRGGDDGSHDKAREVRCMTDYNLTQIWGCYKFKITEV